MAAESRPRPDHSADVIPTLRVDGGAPQAVARDAILACSSDVDPPRADRHGHDRQPQPGGLVGRRGVGHRVRRARDRAKSNPVAERGAATRSAPKGCGPGAHARARTTSVAQAGALGTPRGVTTISAERLSKPVGRSLRFEHSHHLAQSISHA
jgi:hypothetical protein